MTINDLANVRNADVDNTTGKRISHSEKYQRIIKALGYEDVKKCIPYTIDQIKKALPQDKHLNNLPIKEWDVASGVYVSNSPGARPIITGSPLTVLYRKAGVTSFSQSNGVSILKEAARMWAAEDAE